MGTLTQKLLGFSCAAFIITANQSHEFDELFNWCHKILMDFHEISSLNQSTFSEQCFRKCSGPDNSYQIRNKVSYEDDGLNFNQIYLSSEDFTPGQRAFHPVNSGHCKPLNLILKSLNQNKSDFIQLDTFDATDSLPIGSNLKKKHKQHKNTNRNKYMEKLTDLYHPLTINKIQQNPQKIESFGKKI